MYRLGYAADKPRLGFAQLSPKFGIRFGGPDPTRLPSACASSLHRAGCDIELTFGIASCANLLKLPGYTVSDTIVPLKSYS